MTVHRVKTVHTGKVREGREQPGKAFSAKCVYMETEKHRKHSAYLGVRDQIQVLSLHFSE